MEQMYRSGGSRGASATRRDGARKSAAQQAYRAELEQQIREKEVRKAAAKQREAEDSFPSTPSHKVFPWENTIGRMAGGGGDPVRDRLGNVVTDLREVLIETVGRDRGEWISEMKSGTSTPQRSHAPPHGEEWWERADRKAGRGPAHSSQPMSPTGSVHGHEQRPHLGRHHSSPSIPAPSPAMSPHTPQRHPSGPMDPHHHHRPQPGGPHRVTRVDSLRAEGDVAVVTFVRGGRVSTFNVPGMSVEEFEDMLSSWSAAQQHYSPAAARGY